MPLEALVARAAATTRERKTQPRSTRERASERELVSVCRGATIQPVSLAQGRATNMAVHITTTATDTALRLSPAHAERSCAAAAGPNRCAARRTLLRETEKTHAPTGGRGRCDRVERALSPGWGSSYDRLLPLLFSLLAPDFTRARTAIFCDRQLGADWPRRPRRSARVRAPPGGRAGCALASGDTDRCFKRIMFFAIFLVLVFTTHTFTGSLDFGRIKGEFIFEIGCLGDTAGCDFLR